MKPNVQQTLIGIIVKLKEGYVSRDRIASSTRLIDDVGLDSLDLINLFLMIEDEFEIEIAYSTIDLTTLQTVESVGAFVENHLEREASA